MFDNIEIDPFEVTFESGLSEGIINARLKSSFPNLSFRLRQILLTNAGTLVYTLRVNDTTYPVVKKLDEFINLEVHRAKIGE